MQNIKKRTGGAQIFFGAAMAIIILVVAFVLIKITVPSAADQITAALIDLRLAVTGK